MPGGAGMAAPPSALEPRGVLWAEGAPAGPVLARGTRKNRGRGGREERKRLRAALPPLIPATRPALIQDRRVPVSPVDSALRCAVEVESGGSGACSSHADLTKARHPKGGSPAYGDSLLISLSLPLAEHWAKETEKEGSRTTSHIARTVTGEGRRKPHNGGALLEAKPPSPRLRRRPFHSIKLRFIPRKGHSGARSHPTTL